MFPGGAEFEIVIIDFISGSFLNVGCGMIGLFGVGEFLVPVCFSKVTFVGCLSDFSVLSDVCLLKSALPHTKSKEKVVVAYDQVTQNRRS